MKRALSIFIFLMLAWSMQAQAQVIEDALRLSHTGTVVGTRSAGMGNAFIGLANDATALYWNPAGLAQLRMREFSVGLANMGYSNDASLFSVTENGDNSQMVLTNLNFAVPFPVVRGSFVVAAGYNRILDYNGAMMLDVYNPESSIQASLFNEDYDLDFAWNLGLEDVIVDSLLNENLPGWLAIPVANRVQQTIDQYEEGGLNQWSIGGSMEVAQGAMVGVSLNVLSGSYRYERTFIETDVNNVWQGAILGINPDPNSTNDILRTDFDRLDLYEEINQDLSGWNMRFGFLYNFRDKARFGVSIQTASSITVNEDYYKSGDSYFADGSGEGYDLTFSNHNYEIITPAVYSFGASVNPVESATIAADIELVDYSNIEFNASNDLDAFALSEFNRSIRQEFRSTNNFRVGGEFRVPNTGLALRAGFGYRFSPYEADEGKSEYNVTTLSAGVGYTFEHNISLQAAYVHSSLETFSYPYIDPDTDVPESAFTVNQEIAVSQLMFGLVYRF
ncbi:outer membrane protein transport protein [bacterium]|nr:outer membrane protein transport protein [bacterium]